MKSLTTYVYDFRVEQLSPLELSLKLSFAFILTLKLSNEIISHECNILNA